MFVGTTYYLSTRLWQKIVAPKCPKLLITQNKINSYKYFGITKLPKKLIKSYNLVLNITAQNVRTKLEIIEAASLGSLVELGPPVVVIGASGVVSFVEFGPPVVEFEIPAVEFAATVEFVATVVEFGSAAVEFETTTVEFAAISVELLETTFAVVELLIASVAFVIDVVFSAAIEVITGESVELTVVCAKTTLNHPTNKMKTRVK